MGGLTNEADGAACTEAMSETEQAVSGESTEGHAGGARAKLRIRSREAA